MGTGAGAGDKSEIRMFILTRQEGGDTPAATYPGHHQAGGGVLNNKELSHDKLRSESRGAAQLSLDLETKS